MNKKQTAVEWLVKQLSNELIEKMPMHRWNELSNIINQALDMEKGQIEDAHYDGLISNHEINEVDITDIMQDYYKNTYGK